MFPEDWPRYVVKMASGAGLRRMYFGNDVVRETVSVMGTPASMDFVESIQSEGVTAPKTRKPGSWKPRAAPSSTYPRKWPG